MLCYVMRWKEGQTTGHTLGHNSCYAHALHMTDTGP